MDLNLINTVDFEQSTELLFPSCIHHITIKNFDQYKDILIKETYQEREENPVSKRRSNRGGWQSDINSITKSKSKTLKKIIIDSLKHFEPLKSDVRIYVDGWKNINEPGSYNIKHYHPLSHLSGVLWIKTPDKSGDILFQSPDEFNRYQQLDCYTDDFKFQTNFYHTYRFSPIEGRILIFPSDLEHLVKINESDEDRISYSFNVSLQRPVDIVKEEEYNHEELNKL